MPIILHSIFVAYSTHLQKHPIVQAISVLSFGRLARMTCPHCNLDIAKPIQKVRTKSTNLGNFEFWRVNHFESYCLLDTKSWTPHFVEKMVRGGAWWGKWWRRSWTLVMKVVQLVYQLAFINGIFCPSQCWMFAPIGWIPMLDVGCVFCHFFCYAFFLKTFLINEDGRNFGPRFSPQKGMNGSNTSMWQIFASS